MDEQVTDEVELAEQEDVAAEVETNETVDADEVAAEESESGDKAAE